MKNLNKLWLFLLVFIISVVTTGCANIDTEVSIDKNGNAKVETTTKMSDAVGSDFINEEYEEIKEKYEDYGNNMEISKFSQQGKMGIKIAHNTKDINKNDIFLPELFEATNQNKRFLSVKHNLFYTRYIINWKFHLDKIDDEMLTSEQQKLFNSTLKINIPVKALSSNADRRNDITNSYEWEFDTTKVNNIFLEYQIANLCNIIVSIFLILNLILLIVLVLKKFNKKYLLYSSIPLFALIIYLISSIFICLVNDNINKKPLPINYYRIAKKEACPECMDGQFVDDYAAVKINDKYGLVNKENDFILKPENKYVENLNGDYCLVCKEDRNKCAYFNKKDKKYLTDFKYACGNEERSFNYESYVVECSTGFFEGLARVVVNDHDDIKMGFINSNGEEVIKPQYRLATTFNDGRAFVKETLNSKEYEIDKKGQRVETKEKNSKKDEQDKVDKKNEVETNNISKNSTTNEIKTTKQIFNKSVQKNNVQVQKVTPNKNTEVDDFMN